ncbi:MAG TPA: TonB-dependent receptor [Vicinamibacterales bacterium]|nr:TonB-dependent receptor [Vicinamibacterales bacterium]
MLVLLLIANLLQAATVPVRGRVVDSLTGAPLARVLVSVEDTGTSAHTDADGRFELQVEPGRRRLFVSLVGYVLARREIDVAQVPLELEIPLVEGTGTYTETVVVSADRFVQAEPAVAAQHLLGSADLQNLRGVLADDPLRAVQVLPGVVAGDDLRSEFTVRASPFAHINMTIDGFATPYILHTVRAVEDYTASGSVAMINSDILQDVALLSGGYPQRFGNRTGAEIDFRLREGSRDRSQARVAVSGTNASAVFEGPLGGAKRGSWLVSARQSYLDLIVRQIQEGVQFGFTDAQAKGVYDLTPAQRFELAFVGGRSSLQEDDGSSADDDAFVGRNRSAILVAGWRWTSGRAVLTARSMAALNAFSNTTEGGVRIDDGHDKQLAARIEATVVVSKAVSLEGGADADLTRQRRMRQRFITGRYRPVNDFTDAAVKSGGYAQARISAGPLTLVPGLRADHWDLTGDTTQSPWLQAQLALPAGLTVRAGAGVYQQFPSFEQVVGALAAATTWPQRAEQVDVGLEQRIGAASRWQITFYSREESSFFRRPGAETRLVNGRAVLGSRAAPFVQSLDGYARGVELLLQRKSHSGFSGWMAYSYGRNRYTDAASGESFDGDFDQRHTLNLYGFLRTSDRTSFSAKVRIGTNTPAPGYYRDEGGVLYLSAQRNELRMPLYSRVDVRANRTFNWSRSRMTLFAEVMNVLNRDNVRFTPPSVSTRTLIVRNMFEQMIPVVPSVGVLFEF